MEHPWFVFQQSALKHNILSFKGLNLGASEPTLSMNELWLRSIILLVFFYSYFSYVLDLRYANNLPNKEKT